MRPDRFAPLTPTEAEAVLPIASSRYREQAAALAWWPDASRGLGLAALAFAAEVGAIPEKVREPGILPIRYQFWRDITEEAAKGTARAHPVARGLASAFAGQGARIARLQQFIDRRERSAHEGSEADDVAKFLRELLPDDASAGRAIDAGAACHRRRLATGRPRSALALRIALLRRVLLSSE